MNNSSHDDNDIEPILICLRVKKIIEIEPAGRYIVVRVTRACDEPGFESRGTNSCKNALFVSSYEVSVLALYVTPMWNNNTFSFSSRKKFMTEETRC